MSLMRGISFQDHHSISSRFKFYSKVILKTFKSQWDVSYLLQVRTIALDQLPAGNSRWLNVDINISSLPTLSRIYLVTPVYSYVVFIYKYIVVSKLCCIYDSNCYM